MAKLCQGCNRTFQSADALKQHAKAKHGFGRVTSMADITCPYCQEPAILIKSSAELYRGKDYGPAWICRDCQAWVGCHPNTIQPLGRLADARLRAAKQAAHRAFDPLWKEEGMTRSSAYSWLARQMGLTKDRCHIGMFDLDECNAVVEHSLHKRGSLV